MPEALTIRERIELRLVAILEAVTDVEAVHRQVWADQTIEHQHAYLYAEGEDTSVGGLGDIGGSTTAQRFRVHVAVAVAMSPADREHEAPASVYNRWLGRIRDALTADPYLTDTLNAGEKLANTGEALTLVESNDPPVEPGQPEFFVIQAVEIVYEHTENDTTAGPNVTAYTPT